MLPLLPNCQEHLVLTYRIWSNTYCQLLLTHNHHVAVVITANNSSAPLTVMQLLLHLHKKPNLC
jgi:hypothetical protein